MLWFRISGPGPGFSMLYGFEGCIAMLQKHSLFRKTKFRASKVYPKAYSGQKAIWPGERGTTNGFRV